MDERGVEAEPDLGLVRDLLRCRETVLNLTDPWVWPELSLKDTVVDVAPFVLSIDAAWCASASRTLPVLRDFILFEGRPESADLLRQETDSVLSILSDEQAQLLEHPAGWAALRRLAGHHCCPRRRNSPPGWPIVRMSGPVAASARTLWRRR